MSEELLKEVLSTVKRLEGTVTELKVTVKSVDQRVGNLEVEVKGIRVEHGTLLRALEERTSVTNAIVTRLAEDMDHVKGDVARIVKRIDDHDIEIKVIKKAMAN